MIFVPVVRISSLVQIQMMWYSGRNQTGFPSFLVAEPYHSPRLNEVHTNCRQVG